MKTIISVMLACCFFNSIHAQKTEFKDGIIQVDGAPLVKMEVEKKNFGLTKAFQVFSLSGKKLVIAAPATEFETDKSDNSTLYYRLTFLTSNQVGIFKVNAVGQEKSFVKLIGTSGIFIKDSTDDAKVKEFIAIKSASPTVAVDYTVIPRSRIYPVRLFADKHIEQEKTIGRFKATGSSNGTDQYEFMLPSGTIVAKVSFTGGNEAKNFEVFTPKDNYKRVVPVVKKEQIISTEINTDKNDISLSKITYWLVENNYL